MGPACRRYFTAFGRNLRKLDCGDRNKSVCLCAQSLSSTTPGESLIPVTWHTTDTVEYKVPPAIRNRSFGNNSDAACVTVDTRRGAE